MGKRSDFKRIEKDFYPTPYEACLPLFPHLDEHPGHKFTYYEPCVGRGDLIRHLKDHATCVGHSDLYKGVTDFELMDARSATYDTIADYFITNPPWSREALHDIIVNLSEQKLTWLLLDADWMHTIQAVPYLKRCYKIQSVGRVKWIPDSPHTGMDNAAWYLFYHEREPARQIEFYPRIENLGRHSKK